LPASASLIRVMRVSSNPSSFAKAEIRGFANKRLPNGESHVPGEQRRFASGPNDTPRGLLQKKPSFRLTEGLLDSTGCATLPQAYLADT
jgi:hypothetical protein